MRLYGSEASPFEGSKSLKVNSLRLFHVSQTREIAKEELKAIRQQQEAAVARHEGKSAKGKSATVTAPHPAQ